MIAGRRGIPIPHRPPPQIAIQIGTRSRLGTRVSNPIRRFQEKGPRWGPTDLSCLDLGWVGVGGDSRITVHESQPAHNDLSRFVGAVF